MQPHSSRALPSLGTDSSRMVLELSYGSGLCPHQKLYSQALAAGPGSRLGLSGNPEGFTAFGLRATDEQVGFGSEKGRRQIPRLKCSGVMLISLCGGELGSSSAD